MKSIAEPDVQAVIREAVSDYFDGCRGRVDGFIARHFRYPGAWATNKPAFGWDLLRAPVNMFWAPLYLLILLLAGLARRLGWHRLGECLRRAPDGIETSVQAYIAASVYRDLLQRSDNPEQPDQLRRTILEALGQLAGPQECRSHVMLELEPVIADALVQYRLTRLASADIANSLLSAAVGAFAFKKFTPGGIAVGLLLASWLAQRQAIDNFFFGELLGSLYYRLFPAQPSLGLGLLGIAAALAFLAVCASFSGLLVDPIQSWTGLHRHRLNKLIDHLQRDFEVGSGNTFRPRDAYLARILEILDAAKSHLS